MKKSLNLFIIQILGISSFMSVYSTTNANPHPVLGLDFTKLKTEGSYAFPSGDISTQGWKTDNLMFELPEGVNIHEYSSVSRADDASFKIVLSDRLNHGIIFSEASSFNPFSIINFKNIKENKNVGNMPSKETLLNNTIGRSKPVSFSQKYPDNTKIFDYEAYVFVSLFTKKQNGANYLDFWVTFNHTLVKWMSVGHIDAEYTIKVGSVFKIS